MVHKTGISMIFFIHAIQYNPWSSSRDPFPFLPPECPVEMRHHVAWMVGCVTKVFGFQILI